MLLLSVFQRLFENYFSKKKVIIGTTTITNIFSYIIENQVRFVAPDIFFSLRYYQHTSPTGTGALEFNELNLYSPYSTHFHSECNQGILLLRNQIPVAVCSFKINHVSSEILVYQIQSLGRLKNLFNQIDYPVWFLEILSMVSIKLVNYTVKVQSVSNNKWRIENNPIVENRHVHSSQILGSYDKGVQRFNKQFANQYKKIELF